MPNKLVHRFRRWVIGALAVGVVLFLVASNWAGGAEISAELAHFDWTLAVPILALVSLNYALRFAKWHYLLLRLGVKIPLRADAWNFVAGLSMTISPGKAGELLKPYVVRELTGTPMATTIPALVTERLTDVIAIVALASISVTTYAGDRVHYLLIPSALIVVGLGILSSRNLSMSILGLLGRLPLISRVAHKLEEMYTAMRSCVSPASLTWTVFLSFVAWGAECVAYLLVFRGLSVAADLEVSTFLYTFATVAGGAMPGGLGVADGALVGGAMQLIPELGRGQAVAAALLIRGSTLWFGVGLGAIALFRVSTMLGGRLDLDGEGEPTSPA